MASSKWKNWEELSALIRDKRVVFWGASNWVERALEKISISSGVIVDNNPSNYGIVYCGFDVHPPSHLLGLRRDEIYVVVCTVNYASVIEELNEMGFVMGDEFCCNPLLNERKSKDDLRNLERKVLVSSPQHAFSNSHGGGVYECDTKSGEYRKVFTGKCRGMTYQGDDLLVIDMLRGLVVLDPEFREKGVVELQPNSEPHGAHYDPSSGCVFIGQPGRDSVAVYSMEDRKLLREFFFSRKWSQNQRDNHHVNDCWVHGDSLYVSIFSFSGSWLQEVYDGGILELDKVTGEILGPVVTGLWMPHSVSRFNGKLCYLDSMRGELFDNTWNCQGRFSSFVRGLDHDGRYYFVGATEHRYPEKLKGISLNISLDTGLYVFDPETKMSRFLELRQAETVHSLILRRFGDEPVS